MIQLLRREFTVELPVEKAWRHLARVEQWPSWAKHIKEVRVQPPGPLELKSVGIIHLINGIKTRFAMTEFNPYRNWKWVGRFLWLSVHYDHQFEELNGRQTKLIWIVEGGGLGVSVLGRVFAKVYNKNLDRGIPLLIEEIKAL